MSKRLVAMLVAVAALAVAAGGCGDSDKESLTKDQYVKRAIAICEADTKQLGSELQARSEEQDGKKANQQQVTAVVEEVALPHFRSQLDELQDLPAPSGDEDQITAMLDTIESGIEEGEENPEEFLEAPDNQLGKGRQMAEKYGLERCMVLF